MKGKTFKRELAALLTLFLCFIAWKASNAEVGAGEVNQPLETLKVIILPMMLYIGAAFGMQWASTQTGLMNRS